MGLEFTLWFVGAVIVAEAAATLNIWYLHRRANTPVDVPALSAALGIVTLVALVGYMCLTMLQ